MRHALSLLVLVAVSVAPVEASVAAGHQDADDRQGLRCQGQRATIVGRHGMGRLAGTKGPDVIVTNGARTVRATDGADRVCITKRSAGVHGGRGDDVVRVVGAVRGTSVVSLGPGEDRFVGGDGPDWVEGHNNPNPFGDYGDDDHRDVILTHGGKDRVLVGGKSGLADRVDLGSGQDYIEIESDRTVESGRIDGGAGSDRLKIKPRIVGTEVTLNAATGVGTSDGSRFLTFSGLEEFDARIASEARVVFTGTDRSEDVELHGGVLSGNLGGGDDFAQTYFGPPGSTAELLGGEGEDSLYTWAEMLSLDVAAGTASAGPERGLRTFDGFESYYSGGYILAIAGSTAGEKIEAGGCEVTVHGDAGDDDIRVFSGPEYDFCETTAPPEAYGEAGDDILTGGDGDDILIGGSGQDSADGLRGEDVCEAEVRDNCEP